MLPSRFVVATRNITILLFTLLASGCAGRVDGATRRLTLNDYQKYFDRVHADNASLLRRQAASGDGHTYYTFSYALEGALAMYEGTGELKYLEQVLDWAETMVSTATIVDTQGKHNWNGRWASPHADRPIASMLDELQGSTALARLARLVLSDAMLKQKYGARASATYRFVKDHIADKHLARADGWFRAATQDTSKQYTDKAALLVRILLDLHAIDANSTYLSLARELLDDFKQRLRPYRGGSLIWDLDASAGSYDTSHANRFPFMAVDAYQAGVVITRRDLDGLASLLTDVIWDRSIADPRFTNYIDGRNAAYRKRGPWSAGQIYSGWVTLGAYNIGVQTAGDAVLGAIIAGVRNPSVQYMSTVHGKLNLCGFLARNRAFLERQGLAAPRP